MGYRFPRHRNKELFVGHWDENRKVDDCGMLNHHRNLSLYHHFADDHFQPT